MKRPALKTTDAPRKLQDSSGQPIGFLRSIKDQIDVLKKDINGVRLRLTKQLDNGEPAGIVAEHVFKPDTNQTFAFDYLMDGVAGTRVTSQYVLRDGVTYDIPIVMPPPGVMLIRTFKVRMLQRLYIPGCGVTWVPMHTGDFFVRNAEVYQTKKFSFPDNGDTNVTVASRPGVRQYSRRLSFVWNLVDTKSGRMYADDLVPDQVLLPQGIGIPAMNSMNTDGGPSGLPMGVTGRYLEFKTPWLFERDGQLSFLFRPLFPVIQPAASSAYAPYPFEDRENGTAVRDSSVKVCIDLHGERYRSVRDAMKEGARSR